MPPRPTAAPPGVPSEIQTIQTFWLHVTKLFQLFQFPSPPSANVVRKRHLKKVDIKRHVFNIKRVRS